MIESKLGFSGKFRVECYDQNGNFKWEDTFNNTVVDEGINHILDALFDSATSQVDPWYVGLLSSSPTVSASDTLTELNEDTTYDGDRKEFVNARTNQTVDNSADKASFSINGTTTVGGAFLASVSTGTTGILLCGSAFNNGDKPVDNGDTLNVEYQFSGSSA